ncbi:lipase [Tumebacillus sp. ITR2]|uniref:triacylglycerol lipase n=1 Tax=Tumebacillus amylolyticus TaxID=2801339 RepID=A0ABS1JBX5_9BACL|nr:lipase [Tumebacillus amylolyticus]MBL0387772.1 lipase [Tumebacillus amylolyticus]
MKKTASLLLTLSILSTSFLLTNPASAATTRQNYAPIVLVHGFSGWGRDEMLGYKYWGGFTDIQEDLKNYNYTTYTAAVGPVSSNWERACELYAEIKGGTVDYGAAHAKKYGVSRYGRTYPGMFPQWGDVNPTTGKINKVNLVGHSMGGQTIRTLIQLLENGSPDEIASTPSDQLSPLFNGKKKSWVLSATSIATPHDGTTLTNGVEGIVPHAQQIIGTASSIGGLIGEPVYDFKLDQFGLKRQPGESFSSYSDRVYNSPIWTSTHDTAQWDLSPDGAKELNSWVKAQPDVYYFSWSTDDTFYNLLTGHQDPWADMNLPLQPLSFFLGSYTRNQTGHVVTGSSWWKNDGVVNTISMNGPKLGSTDSIVTYNGTPQIGKWNSMGTLPYDHLQAVGVGIYDMRDWYRNLATQLGSLPQ